MIANMNVGGGISMNIAGTIIGLIVPAAEEINVYSKRMTIDCDLSVEVGKQEQLRPFISGTPTPAALWPPSTMPTGALATRATSSTSALAVWL